MKRNEFRNAFPQTPEHFVRRMEDVLSEIEGVRPMRRKKVWRTALIAAVLVLVLAGSAAAIANAMGVFDFMKRVADPIEPLQGAEELVESGLGYAEHSYGSIEITEGIYSGRSCKVTVKVRNNEGYSHFYPEIAFLNAQTPGTGVVDMAEGENGEVQYMLESILAEDAPESLECEVSVPIFKNGEAQKSIRLMFTLHHANEDAAKLVPQNAGERWKILSGSITRNEFSIVFDIEFEYTAEEGEDMGVDIRAFDESGNQYAMGDTSYGDRGLPVIGKKMVWRQIAEIQSTEAMPEKIVFKPKVIGEDKWLDEIVCEIE